MELKSITFQHKNFEIDFGGVCINKDFVKVSYDRTGNILIGMDVLSQLTELWSLTMIEMAYYPENWNAKREEDILLQQTKKVWKNNGGNHAVSRTTVKDVILRNCLQGLI